MTIKSFCQLEKVVQRLKPSRIVVVSAEDEKVLTGIKLALKKGIIYDPILVGDSKKIKKILLNLGEGIKDYQIINASTPFDAAQIAIKLIKDGDAHILAKGKIKSNIFLKLFWIRNMVSKFTHFFLILLFLKWLLIIN